MEVSIDEIRPSPYQPRLLFDLEDLKQEIQRDGLLSALVVRKRDEYYELLDGERRLRALKEMGWKTVPIDLREVDEQTARRSVFKLNKIRENYTVEEEARYYKKLADEGMTAWEISEELGVDFHWVLANLNAFKLPKDMQALIFTGGHQLTVSHIQELERTFGRSTEEAIESVKVILERNLRVAETRQLAQQRDKAALEKTERERIEAARKAMPEMTTEAVKLETPEDYEKAAEALKKEAKRRGLEALTGEDWLILAQLKAAQEAEKEAKAEERKQQKDELEGQREERATKKARKQLLEDRSFLGEVLSSTPRELIEEKIFTPEEREILSKPRKPTTVMDQFYELEKLADRLYESLGELGDQFPAMGKAVLGSALQRLTVRIDETLEAMGIEIIEGEAKLIAEE